MDGRQSADLACTDGVTVALLAALPRHDRFDRLAGVAGALTGWILLFELAAKGRA